MRLYWNQMGPDIYGSIENALRQMLEDGGEEIQRLLRKELMLIGQGDGYREWLSKARSDVKSIRQMGGASILPEDVPVLLAVIEEWPNRKLS
jgi:hypothetical protein